MKKLLYLPIAFIAIFVLTGCSNVDDIDNIIDAPNEKPLKISPMQEKLVIEYNDFSSQLFTEIAKSTEGNLVFSPLSTQYVLGMLSNGQENDESGILKRFGAESPQQLNEFNRLLLNRLPELSPKMAKFKVANGIWVDKKNILKPNFAGTISSYYDASIRSCYFDQENMQALINNWISSQTGGMITNFFDQKLTSDNKFALISTVYFEGKWKVQFDDMPQTYDFYDMSQENIIGKVRMIGTNDVTSMYIKDDNAYFALLIGNGSYEMVICVSAIRKYYDPADDLDFNEINEITNISDPNNPYRLKGEDNFYKVQIPVFDISSNYNLTDYLDKAGIELADKYQDLMMDDVDNVDILHGSRIKIDRHGTVAASATGGIRQTTAVFMPGQPFVIDSPFAFFIREKDTGLVLFAGVYREPETVK